MITAKRFRDIEAVLRRAGYGMTIEHSKAIAPPIDADAFAERAIYVICNSGMKNSVAAPIFHRCMMALRDRGSVASAFGHPGKRSAIDTIWNARGTLHRGYLDADDQLHFLRSMPWIGPVTSLHLAKNLGADVAKPDVHMERLARRDKTTTRELCRRLSRQTGHSAATIDTVLWRACADGLLNSSFYELHGWHGAFQPQRFLAQRNVSED